MPRKGPAPHRPLIADPVYSSPLVTQLINKILMRGKRQLARYPHATVTHHLVDRLARNDGTFTAHTQAGEWTGRVVILATGVLDHYPHFDGWQDYVGTSMFWCITCDGYENRGRDILVVGHTDAAANSRADMRDDRIGADVGHGFRFSAGGQSDFLGGRHAWKGQLGLSWHG